MDSISRKRKERFVVCHSGLDPVSSATRPRRESSDFGSYEIWQRHWIPVFTGMTIVGVLWTAYWYLTFETATDVSKNIRFQQVISSPRGFSDYFGQV